MSDASPRSEPCEPSEPAVAGLRLSPQDFARREAIASLLREHQGNVTAVARAMGKARVQIQRWIKRYGLDRLEAAR